MLVQRFGSKEQIEDSYIDSFIELKKKYPLGFDGVWLTTSYGFPSLEVHKNYAQKLKAVAEKLRSAGIKVSMQLANSIGHGSYMADYHDCSGLTECEYKTQLLIGESGQEGVATFCWNSEVFRSYLRQEINAYCTAVKPDILWIDDDFRANNHYPVNYGCFCPDCINKFNQLYGSSFDRESLVKTILYEDLEWRKKWIEFIKNGLSSLMREICEEVHNCSPNTEFGLQNFCNGAYTGFGLTFLFDQMKAVNGKNPHYRAGGGTYKDHNPNDILLKNIYITFQHSFIEKGGCRYPEIENSPYYAYGKSPAGTAFETTYYLANGANGMTYAMMMHLGEPVEWHEREYSLFNQMRPYWDRLMDLSNRTIGVGMIYFMSENACAKTLLEGQGIDQLAEENVLACLSLYRDGFPVVFDKSDNGVYMLRPEIAEYISKEEFELLKTKPVLTCGESVAILTRRGFELPITATPVCDAERNHLIEVYTSDAINGNMNKFYGEGAFDCEHFYPHILSCEEDARILGHFKYVFNRPNGVDGKVSTLIIKLKEGGNWGVLGHAIWRGVKNFTERERILNIADELCGGLSARILSPEQAVLNIRQNEIGQVAGISVTNCTIGFEEDVKVLVRKPAGKKAYLQGQYQEFEEIKFKEVEHGVILTIPKITPWSVVTVFFE